MNLQDLRYLVALADHGHFGRAADACHITQPTLSAQLKKLEEFLGVTVFERTSKSLTLTAAGTPILAKAREIIAGADMLVELAKEQAKPLSGALHLGVIPTLGPYLLPYVLPALKKAFPNLRLVLHEDLTGALLPGLKTHRLDAALLALPFEDSDLAERPLFDEPFYLACPAGHALAKAPRVDPSDLGSEPLLLLTDGHCLRDQALAVCGTHVTKSDTADFRATSLETIRQMVAAGLGLTLMPALAATAVPAPITMRPLDGEPCRRIGLVWRKTYPRPADMTALADVLIKALPASVTAL